MRFSLKWLLAGTVYVAIAAAAFARPHWAYSDALWLVTFFAIVYGINVAIFARGPRRVAATGFTVASLSVLLCLQFSPDSLPTSRWIVAMSPGQLATQTYTVMVTKGGQAVPDTRTRTVFVPQSAGSPRTAPGRALVSLETYTRPANAVATMAAGLVGAALGTVAYRRGRVEREGE